MSTVAPPLIKQLAADWKNKCGLKSAQISGVIGDSAHAARGGYHIGRRFQPSSNYSVVRPDDTSGPDDAAAAIDMTLNPADMRLCTGRLVLAFTNSADPRRKYLNAFNGTTDSKNARRWDVYARKVKAATADHLWHIHLEVRRKYVGSPVAMAAVLSILKGESVATYLKSAGSMKPAASVSSSSTGTPPAFPGTLRRNDAQKTPNPSLVLFQKQLIARGLTCVGSPDGLFGPKLESAVKAWQAKVGLGADGVVGPVTWPTPWSRK